MTLRGRPGLVARVDRWPTLADGQLVVLEHRAGRLQTLIDSDEAKDAWHCRLLGPPVEVRGKRVRSLYVPDEVLTPVGEMNSDQIAELGREQAKENFDEILGDLRRIIENSESTGQDLFENFDDRLSTAGEQALVEHSLEVVAMGTVLHELGFRPVAPELDMQRWPVEREGVRMIFEAIQTPFDSWQLACTGVTRREAVCAEAVAPAEGARGLLLVPLLGLWKDALGGVPVPQAMRSAQTFQRHRVAVRAAAPLPTVYAEPKVFRAIRRWLAERFGSRADTVPVKLSPADGMLRVEAEGVAFGCPAHGLWPEPCVIALVDLLALPWGVLMRRRLALELTADELLINGCPLPRV